MNIWKVESIEYVPFGTTHKPTTFTERETFRVCNGMLRTVIYPLVYPATNNLSIHRHGCGFMGRTKWYILNRLYFPNIHE